MRPVIRDHLRAQWCRQYQRRNGEAQRKTKQKDANVIYEVAQQRGDDRARQANQQHCPPLQLRCMCRQHHPKQDKDDDEAYKRQGRLTFGRT